MILGTGPTQQNPVNFTPPNPGNGSVPSLPHTGFYSHNIWPFSPVMHRMSSFPAWRPGPPNGVGLQPMPSLSPPPVAAPAAPAPGPSPSGTAGAFGGSGFGSSGGVRQHGSHVDPYLVMRAGIIPGVSPSGSNIRSGYMDAGRRVHNSMPYQSHALPVAMATAAAIPAAMPMPATTHGFGGFSWNPVHWFKKPSPRPSLQPMAHQNGPVTAGSWDMTANAKAQHAAIKAQSPNCETIGPRLDGTLVTICNGRVVAISDAAGNFSRVG